jgi:beta-glucosidase
VVSTVKHFALNGQETNRHWANSVIEEGAHRESDLLAFQIAIEKGQPGSVMCAYNLVNGDYSCGNDHLLNGVLKGDWAYKGWVMSDWGAVHAMDYAVKGLDQQSGEQLDDQVWFGAPLKAAVEKGEVPAARLSDMTRRILRSMFAAGLFDVPAVKSEIDYTANAEIARRRRAGRHRPAEEPRGAASPGQERQDHRRDRRPRRRRRAVGRRLLPGRPAGRGQGIHPAGRGGHDGRLPQPDPAPVSAAGRHPRRGAGAKVSFNDGRYLASAVAAAKAADVVIVFGNQWMGEGEDAPDLSLPEGQDALIAAVTAANPNSIVVLQTGGR